MKLILMVGLAFDAALKGTQYDPVLLSQSVQATQAFSATLTGRQLPAILTEIERRRVIVFETCAQNNCAGSHSVIAIDVDTDEEYVASYVDDARTLLHESPFGKVVDQHCARIRCDFVPTQLGVLSDGEPLSSRDYDVNADDCVLRNQKGQIVYYASQAPGKEFGVFRFNGKRRMVWGDVFKGDVYSQQPEPDLVIRFEKQNETLSVLRKDRWITIPTEKYC
jgi:hypothetical protein